MTAKAIKASPGVSFTAFQKVTCPVYSVTDDYVFSSAVVPYDSSFPIKGVSFLATILDKYRDFSVNAFPHLFMYSGFILWVLAVFVLAKCKLTKWHDWKKIFLILPLFIYNFGTMFLLTSAWDACGYFYYSFLVAPLMLMVFISKNKAEYSIAKEHGND